MHVERDLYGKSCAGTFRGICLSTRPWLMNYFPLLTRTLSEKPSSKKIDFFGTHFLTTWPNKPCTHCGTMDANAFASVDEKSDHLRAAGFAFACMAANS